MAKTGKQLEAVMQRQAPGQHGFVEQAQLPRTAKGQVAPGSVGGYKELSQQATVAGKEAFKGQQRMFSTLEQGREALRTAEVGSQRVERAVRDDILPQLTPARKDVRAAQRHLGMLDKTSKAIFGSLQKGREVTDDVLAAYEASTRRAAELLKTAGAGNDKVRAGLDRAVRRVQRAMTDRWVQEAGGNIERLSEIAHGSIAGAHAVMRDISFRLARSQKQMAKQQARIVKGKALLADPTAIEQAVRGSGAYRKFKQNEVGYVPHVMTDDGFLAMEKAGLIRPQQGLAHALSLADQQRMTRTLRVKQGDRWIEMPTLDEANEAWNADNLYMRKRIKNYGVKLPRPKKGQPEPPRFDYVKIEKPKVKTDLFESDPLKIAGIISERNTKLIGNVEYLNQVSKLGYREKPSVPGRQFSQVTVGVGPNRKSVWFDDEVAKSIERTERFMRDPGVVSQWGRMIHQTEDFLRRWAWLPFPSSWRRNLFGEAFMDYADGMPIWAVGKSRVDAAMLLKKVANNKASQQELDLYEKALQMRVLRTTGPTHTIMQETKRFSLPIRVGGKIQQSIEDISRFGSWLYHYGNLKKTKAAPSPEEMDQYRKVFDGWTDDQVVDQWHAMKAQQRVMNTHYDYASLTPIERRYIKPWFFFYTFTRHNLPKTLERIMKRPVRFNRLAKTTRAWNEAMGGEPEQRDLPEHVQGEELIRLPQYGQNDAATYLLLGREFGYDDINRMIGKGLGPWLYGQMSPFASSIVQNLTGTDPMSGRPMRPYRIPGTETDVPGAAMIPLRAFRPTSEALNAARQAERSDKPVRDVIERFMLGATVREDR